MRSYAPAIVAVVSFCFGFFPSDLIAAGKADGLPPCADHLNPPAASPERLEKMVPEFLRHLSDASTEAKDLAVTYSSALRAYAEGNFASTIDQFALEYISKDHPMVRTIISANVVLNPDDLGLHMGIDYLQRELIPGRFGVHQRLMRMLGYDGHLFKYEPQRDVIFLPAVGFSPNETNRQDPDYYAQAERMVPDPGQDFALPTGTIALDPNQIEQRAVLRYLAEGYLEEFWHWLQHHASPDQPTLTPLGRSFRQWIEANVGLEQLGDILASTPKPREREEDVSKPPRAPLSPEIVDGFQHLAEKLNIYHARLDSVVGPSVESADPREREIERFFCEADFALLMLYTGRRWLDGDREAFLGRSTRDILRSYQPSDFHWFARTLGYKFLYEKYGLYYRQVMDTHLFEGLDI